MAKRGGAVHVATTRRRHKGKVYETHLLRRTYREAGQVKHETLGNLSHLPGEILELVRGALAGETYLPASARMEVVRSLPHGHVAAVVGTLRKIGLETAIATRRSRSRDLVVAMVAARVLEPGSKLATARGLSPETAASSLGAVLGLGAVDEDELYAALDWLGARQPSIETTLAKRHLTAGCLVLYDVSSSYYTGRHCPLAQFGYNRDRKQGFPQVVYGLLCNREGCPVAVEVFAGNTADPATLRAQIEKLRQRFGLKRVVLVGDRGMLTEARIDRELKPAGLDWISALRGPALQRLVKEGTLQLSLFDEQGLAEIHSPAYPGERLIACRNPLLADERARKREELIRATEKALVTIVAATQRAKRPLRGRAAIGLRVGRVLHRYKVGKYFRLTITDETFAYARHEERIARDAAVDGLYVIRTSVPEDSMGAEDTVRAYKDLAHVEAAFRSLKSVDLKIRPIHHRRTERVRAHVFVCLLAYYVEWHMRRGLAPMLFDDEDPTAAHALRPSIVAPAVRSPSAAAKARRKRTEDGMPVHSFQTLLADLATVAKNRMRPQAAHGAPGAEFDLLTTPTLLQRQVFERLGVSPAL